MILGLNFECADFFRREGLPQIANKPCGNATTLNKLASETTPKIVWSSQQTVVPNPSSQQTDSVIQSLHITGILVAVLLGVYGLVMLIARYAAWCKEQRTRKLEIAMRTFDGIQIDHTACAPDESAWAWSHSINSNVER